MEARSRYDNRREPTPVAVDTDVDSARHRKIPRQLPAGWLFTPFEQTIRSQVPTLARIKQSSYLSSGRYPVVDQGRRTVAGYWNDATDLYKGALPVIVFGDHTRVFKFVDHPFVVGADGVRVLIPDTTRFDSFFLFLALSVLNIPSRGYNRHYGLLRECLIPTPPLSDQRAVAAILRTVQQAKEACNQVIATTRQLKRSLMNHLFTYGPVPHNVADSVDMRESTIGPMPAHWDVEQLRLLASRGGTVDPAKAPLRRFRYVDVSSISSENMCIEESVELLGQEAPSRARKLLRSNDVIFATIRPSLRRIALVPRDLDGQVCSTAFCVLRPRADRLIPGFLFYAMCTDRFVERVTQHQSGTSYPAVSDSVVLNELIPVPPLAEQQQIADVLACVDQKLICEERKRLALDMLWKSLLSSLLTARVRLPEQEESQS